MPVCGSGAVVSAWSLLIRRPQRACRQAETPLIVLCRFPGPALKKDERLAAHRGEVDPIRGVHAQHTYCRYVADFPHVRCSLRLTVCQPSRAMVCASDDTE